MSDKFKFEFDGVTIEANQETNGDVKFSLDSVEGQSVYLSPETASMLAFGLMKLANVKDDE